LTFGFRHLAFAALRAILMRFRGGIFPSDRLPLFAKVLA
jgi:hypothetical protein